MIGLELQYVSHLETRYFHSTPQVRIYIGLDRLIFRGEGVFSQARDQACRPAVSQPERTRPGMSGSLRPAPGEVVEENQPIATNFDLLGNHMSTLRSPSFGIILSLATMPAVKPGEPVCHIAIPEDKFGTVRKHLAEMPGRALHLRASRDLATSFALTAPTLLEPPAPDVLPLED